MRSMIKLFLVLALFSGSMSAGDQGNGGYAPCTVDCPPPCTEDCDPENGLSANMTTNPSMIGNLEAEFGTDDIIVAFVTEYYRMLL